MRRVGEPGARQRSSESEQHRVEEQRAVGERGDVYRRGRLWIRPPHARVA